MSKFVEGEGKRKRPPRDSDLGRGEHAFPPEFTLNKTREGGPQESAVQNWSPPSGETNYLSALLDQHLRQNMSFIVGGDANNFEDISIRAQRTGSGDSRRRTWQEQTTTGERQGFLYPVEFTPPGVPSNIITRTERGVPSVSIKDLSEEIELIGGGRKRDQSRFRVQLLVNPASMSIDFPRNFSEEYARGGFIVSNNYADQEVITISGTTVGFYVQPFTADLLAPQETMSLFISRIWRNWSAGYNNLMDLVSLYKNNGCLRGTRDKDVISKVLDVTILYDGWVMVGSFRTFSFSEDANSPYLMRYNFTFNARRLYHESWIGSQGGDLVRTDYSMPSWEMEDPLVPITTDLSSQELLEQMAEGNLGT